MPRPRFDRLPPEKQAAILDAAEAEFAAHGYAKASYNRLIEQAGVSKGAMYYYFDDKEDLYVTVLERAFGGLMDALGQVDEVSSPDEFWAAMEAAMMRAVAYFSSSARRGDLARGLMRALTSAEAPEGIRGLFGGIRQLTEQFLTQGQAVGAVRKDLPMSLLVALAMSMGEASDTWLAEHLDELQPQELQTILDKTMEIFQRVCAPTNEPPGR